MLATNDCAPLLPGGTSADQDAQRHTIRKLDRHVLYLAIGTAFLSYIDRGNISFAAKTLCNDLVMDHEQYGLGVTLFYIGYVLTQVASNVVIKKVSPPTWLSILLFCWGSIATAMAFIQNKAHFYLLRFFLGLAEGGIFPGIYYYIAMFYPKDYLTGAYAMLFAGTTLSTPIASPVAAGLLSLEGLVSVEGWRLLFFVEGVIPVLYAFLHFALLPSSPELASFLSNEEKEWISSVNSVPCTFTNQSIWDEMSRVVRNKGWWLISLAFCIDFGISIFMSYWMTLIVDDMLYGEDDDGDGDSPKTCGSKHGSRITAVLLTAIPSIVACSLGVASRWFLDNGKIPNRAYYGAVTKVSTTVFLLSWVGLRETSFAAAFLALIGAIGSNNCIGAIYVGLLVDHVDNSLTRTSTAMFSSFGSLGGLVFPPISAKILDDFGYAETVIFCAAGLFLCSFIFISVTDPRAKNRNHNSDSVGRS